MAKDNTKYGRWEHVIVAVDAAIFSIIDGKLHILLIKMTKKEYLNYWAMPGSLVGANESLEDTVARTLLTKTGLKDIFTEQIQTFGSVDRDPFGRVVSVAYMALVHAGNYMLTTTKEYDDVKWFPVDALPKLAYDHRDIVKIAKKRLQTKLEYTNIVHNILPKEFTLTDLQKVYEIILDRELDKRNFRKKILSLGIVTKTEKMRTGEQSRPAALYIFTKKGVHEVEML